jgi:UDP-N-acetylglucosamine pyrophosphorylase
MQGVPKSSGKRDRAVVIMAAGQGKRMKDPTRAKVMYELNGKPMIHYVVDLAYDLGAQRVILIVGHQRETVTGYVTQSHPDVLSAVQDQQLGTGHAVMQAEEALKGFEGDVVVLSGDVPMLTVSTMQQLFHHHSGTKAVATILTAVLDDPTGYGRIIRNSGDFVEKIVEHRDASPEELLVREINSGIYVFRKTELFDGLRHVKTDNSQHEYYLTDVFGYFWKNHGTVSALVAKKPDEIHGINTVDQLEQARLILEARQRAEPALKRR